MSQQSSLRGFLGRTLGRSHCNSCSGGDDSVGGGIQSGDCAGGGDGGGGGDVVMGVVGMVVAEVLVRRSCL